VFRNKVARLPPGLADFKKKEFMTKYEWFTMNYGADGGLAFMPTMVNKFRMKMESAAYEN
jgi:hypothetical protein